MSSGTLDFTGGESGISGSLNSATQVDIQTSALQCFGAGLKKQAFGLGQVTLG
jgi:hypothetical protein